MPDEPKQALPLFQLLDRTLRFDLKAVLIIALANFLPNFILQLLPLEYRIPFHGGFYLMMIAFILLSIIISLGCYLYIHKLLIGEEVHLSLILAETKPLILPLIGTQLLVGFFVMLGILFFIIPGMVLGVLLLLTPMVVIFERKSGMDAIKRTLQLAKDHHMRNFAGFFLIIVVALVVSGTIQAIVGPSEGDMMSVQMEVQERMAREYEGYELSELSYSFDLMEKTMMIQQEIIEERQTMAEWVILLLADFITTLMTSFLYIFFLLSYLDLIRIKGFDGTGEPRPATPEPPDQES